MQCGAATTELAGVQRRLRSSAGSKGRPQQQQHEAGRCRFYIVCKTMESQSTAKAVSKGEKVLSEDKVQDKKKKSAERTAAAAAKKDLFGKDFDGTWESSDGKTVTIAEKDGVFSVNDEEVDGFLNEKSMVVTYKKKVGTYSVVSNPPGAATATVPFHSNLQNGTYGPAGRQASTALVDAACTEWAVLLWVA
jgi:hypothetical protein